MFSSLNEKFSFAVFVCLYSFFCTGKICRSGATGQYSFSPDEFIMNPNEDRGDDFMPTDDAPDVNLNLQSLHTVQNLLQMRKNTSFVIEASESEIVNLLSQGLIQEAQVVPLTTLLDVYDATKEDRTFHPESPDVLTTWPDQEVDDGAGNLASITPENVDDGQDESIEQGGINEDQTGSMVAPEDIDGQSAPIMEENISDDQVEVLQNINDGQMESSMIPGNVNDGQTGDANSNVISTSIIVPETMVLQDSFPENLFQRSATQDSARNSEVKPRGDAVLKIDFKTAQAATTINIVQKKTAKNASQSIINNSKLNQAGPPSIEGASIAQTPAPNRGVANDFNFGNVLRNNPVSVDSVPKLHAANFKLNEMITRRGTNSSIAVGSRRSNNSRQGDYIGRRVSTATTEKISSTTSIAPAGKSLPAVSELRPSNEVELKSSRRFESLEDAQKGSKSGGRHEGRADVETDDVIDFTSQFSTEDFPISNRTNAFTTTAPSLLSSDSGVDSQDSKSSTVDERKSSKKNGTHSLPDAAQDFSALQPVEYVYERTTVKFLNKGPQLLSPSNFQNETWLRALSSLAVSPTDEDVLSSAMVRKPNLTRFTGHRYGEEDDSQRYDARETQPSVVRRQTSSPSNSKHVCGQPSTQLRCGMQPTTPAKKSSPCRKVNFDESGFVRRGDVEDESFYGCEGNSKGKNCERAPGGRPDLRHRIYSSLQDRQLSGRIPELSGRRVHSGNHVTMPSPCKHQSHTTGSSSNRKRHKGRPRLVSYRGQDQYQSRSSGLERY